MKLIKHLSLALMLLISLNVGAQRAPVPVLDFIKVPAVAMTKRSFTQEDVRLAIVRAAAAHGWTLTGFGPSTMDAELVVRDKHVVRLSITYDASQYSARYKGSMNLNYREPKPSVRQEGDAFRAALSEGVQSKPTWSGTYPLAQYVVPRDNTAIHPSYEVWVRTFLETVG